MGYVIRTADLQSETFLLKTNQEEQFFTEKKKHTNEREKEAEAMDTPGVERHRTFSWCSLHWAFTDTSSHQTFKSTFNKANKNTRAAQ